MAKPYFLAIFQTFFFCSISSCKGKKWTVEASHLKKKVKPHGTKTNANSINNQQLLILNQQNHVKDTFLPKRRWEKWRENILFVSNCLNVCNFHWLFRVTYRLNMVAFKCYGHPKNCSQKWRREKENYCFLINFSSKQWAWFCSVQKSILYS